MDKPSGAQEQNVFHGGEVQGLLQLAVIPNWKSSERLAAHHSLTCGTPSTSSSRSILLNLVNTEGWAGGWGGPSASATKKFMIGMTRGEGRVPGHQQHRSLQFVPVEKRDGKARRIFVVGEEY